MKFEPRLRIGEVGLLPVKTVHARMGAFLDQGTEKDLLLPFANQTRRVQAGETVLVAAVEDHDGRPCATMNVYPCLRTDSPYKVGDEVRGRIYETSQNFGLFVAIDDCYSGLVPLREAQGHFEIGEVRSFRVTEVKADGKLNLSARKAAHQQIEPDAELLRAYLAEHGEIPFDDKASPETIAETFGISKAAFKRAVGHLLKEGEIELTEGRIKLTEEL